MMTCDRRPITTPFSGAVTFVALLACIAALAGGCSNAKTRQYELYVHNQTSQPVTLWLTKDGPPIEAGWRSPEDLAIEAPEGDERIAGVVVEPGKVGTAGPVKGEFGPQTNAVLRVYSGATTMSQILAFSRKSPGRLDVVIKPGKNRLTVTDANGELAVTPQ
jgi:hypothetical protein